MKPLYTQPILNSPNHALTRHHALGDDGHPLDHPPIAALRRLRYMVPVQQPGRNRAPSRRNFCSTRLPATPAITPSSSSTRSAPMWMSGGACPSRQIGVSRRPPSGSCSIGGTTKSRTSGHSSVRWRRRRLPSGCMRLPAAGSSTRTSSALQVAQVRVACRDRRGRLVDSLPRRLPPVPRAEHGTDRGSRSSTTSGMKF